MIDFGTWKRAVPIRAAWLAGEIAATGVELGDLAVSSGLDGVWGWLCDRVDREGALALTLWTALPDDDPQRGERPPWWAPDQPNRYVSDRLLWLVEAVGCHLATIVKQAFPESTWEVYTSSNRRDVNRHRTQLFQVPGGPADPARMVHGEVIGHVVHGEPWRPDALSHLYGHLTDDT